MGEVSRTRSVGGFCLGRVSRMCHGVWKKPDCCGQSQRHLGFRAARLGSRALRKTSFETIVGAGVRAKIRAWRPTPVALGLQPSGPK